MMNEKDRQEFVYKEIEAIYEEIDISINQLMLSKRFLKKAIEVSNGAKADYESLFKIATLKLKK